MGRTEIHSQSNSTIKSNIKSLVAESRTSDALALLLELSQPNKQVHDAIHIVLGEFNELTSQRLRGTIDNSEATRRLNTIHDKILIALDSFDSQGKPLPGSTGSSSGRTTKFLLRLGITLLGVALTFAALSYLFKDETEETSVILVIAGYFIGIGSIFVLGAWLIALLFNALKGK